MRKNSLLPNKGLSLSQATSISNLCNQSAQEITDTLHGVNNYKKTVKIDGEDKVILKAKKLPENVLELLTRKSALHACQAFLMENIKAKDRLMKAARIAVPMEVSDVVYPERPAFVDASVGSLGEVQEEWGWEQLKAAELNEFFEAEAHAAHIGQFIHKNGALSVLRNELPTIPALEWITIHDGMRSAIDIEVHHDSVELLKLHNELAAVHREKEQRVNYFKAKVKNLVTAENARIAKHNADLQNAAAKTNNDLQTVFETAQNKANEQANDIRVEFEKTRQAEIAKIAAMRIDVDPRFQTIVDEFLVTLPETDKE